MLTITADTADPREVSADLLVVPVFKGGIEGPGTGALLQDLGIEDLRTTPSFRGDIGQHLLMAAPGLGAEALLLVGLGRMDETDPEQLRRAAGVAARQALGVRRVVTTLAEVHHTSASVEAVAEGFWLGAYRDDRFRSDATPPELREVVILGPSSRLWEARLAIRRAEIYAHATYAARDLVNLPPSRKTPSLLAEAISEMAEGCCEVEVHDDEALRKGGFGGLLGVGRGSSAPPRLVELRYRPAKAMGHVVLVGKGITFDSGGLSLKKPQQMEDMKADMAGAAAIAGACAVLSDLGVRLDVTALLPLAENMPGADAQRPDDVITIHGGTTVEVADTDAEGRLVLADALDVAKGMEPDAIVDLATLTGTAISALGHYAAAAMGNDEDLLTSLLTAAGVVGESIWPLPLDRDLERFLHSTVADVRNVEDESLGKPGGGAITAGLFLQRFVGDVPWAHLDIAGPAFLGEKLARHYLPAGGTGFGVRTLLAWLERRGA